MRTRITVAAIVVLLCGAAVAAQRATFTPISGIAFLIAPPSDGTIRCIGGAPAPGWPPCTPGSKVQVRGLVLTYRTVGSGPDGYLFTGIRTLVFNYEHVVQNQDSRVWGTFRLELDGGRGVWEGTFSGSAAGTVIGHGTEGEVEGMQFIGTYSHPGGFPPTAEFPEEFSGYVIDTNAKK